MTTRTMANAHPLDRLAERYGALCPLSERRTNSQPKSWPVDYRAEIEATKDAQAERLALMCMPWLWPLVIMSAILKGTNQ